MFNFKMVQNIKNPKKNFLQLGPDMLCTKFDADCSKFVGVAKKLIWTQK